jgi:membrane protease YdiL (CAAX protease family)
VVTSLQRTPVRDRAAGAAVAALAVSNVVTNRWLSGAGYVPWNLAVATGLLRLARRAGYRLDELGLDPRDLRPGLVGAAAGAGTVTVGYGVVLASGTGAALFDDRRVGSLSPAAARWHLLVRIPLGTVLVEELAFRGVLPAVLDSRRPGWLPGTIASLLFGLWHVLPSRELVDANREVERAVGGGGATWSSVLAVGITTLAGGALHHLRRRTGHLVAPVAVHLTANVLGFLAARRAWSRPRDHRDARRWQAVWPHGRTRIADGSYARTEDVEVASSNVDPE